MERMPNGHVLRLLVVLVAALALIQCGPQARLADPIAGMENRDLSLTQRMAAAEQAREEQYNDPKRIAALEKLVMEFGHASELRIKAIDQLIEYDPEAARYFLARDLDRIHAQIVLQHAIDIAVANQWTDWTTPLVRRYARLDPTTSDLERPERAALLALNPGASIEQILMAVFSDPDYKVSIRLRADAWHLLYRLTGDDDQRRQMLMAVEARDPLIADLQAGLIELNVMADTLQTIAWLQMLRTEPYAAFWSQARTVVANMDAEQRRGMQMRHLPVLVYLGERSDPMLRQSRSDLLRDLYSALRKQSHHLRGSTVDGPMDEHPQLLAAWAGQLVWADLATMHVLCRAMRDKTTTNIWFEQALADNQDKSTEYGGLLATDNAGIPRPKLYKPMMRRHDKVYYAPKELILDAYTALAHYHFHAWSLKNSHHAGPGVGDLKRVARLQQFNGVVLTSIDANRLNVDFYCKPDIVVDLGTIYR